MSVARTVLGAMVVAGVSIAFLEVVLWACLHLWLILFH